MKKHKTKTLLLWLDALAVRDISKKNTPFLYSLRQQQNWTFGTHQPVFGYSSVPASLFTGVKPNQHKQLCMYQRLQKPDRLMQLASLLPPKPANYAYNLLRYLLLGEDFFVPPINWQTAQWTAPAQRKLYMHPQALPVSTVFDRLKQKRRSFLYSNWPLMARFDGQQTHSWLTWQTPAQDVARAQDFINQLKQLKPDFSFLHLWDVDHVGHSQGPSSAQFKKTIRKYDQLTRKVLTHYNLDRDRVVLFSDHGMETVKKTVDPQSLIKNMKVKWFADSTLLRAWGAKSQLKQLEEKLARQKSGQVLQPQQLRSLHIEKLVPRSFQLLYVLKPGYAFSPSSFLSEEAPKGMHGYVSEQLPKSHLPMFGVNERGKEEMRTEEIYNYLI